MMRKFLIAAAVLALGASVLVAPVAWAVGTAGTPIPVGNHPMSVAFSPDGGTAYVANYSDGTVSVINVATGATGTPIPVGSAPRSVAFSPDGSTAYVANEGSNTVSVIDVATGTTGTPIPVGSVPVSVAFSPDGTTAYVANPGDNTVSVIDVATGATGTPIPVGNYPYSVAFSPDGATAYATNALDNTVSVIDVATGATGTPIPVGNSPYSVAFSPDGTTAYTANLLDNTVSVIDVATGTTGTPIPVGTSPYSVAFSPDGTTAYIANYFDNAVSVISPFPVAPVFGADAPAATGTAGTGYSYTFAASGTPAPTFAVTSGALPAGITLTGAGVLAGTPTTAGSFTFTVTASNGTTPDAISGSHTITISPAPVAPTFTAATPPVTGTAGTGFSYTFAASGIPAPTFAVSSGVLPAGITLTGAGVLAGTPTTPGSFTYTLTASNGITPDAISGSHTITISPAPVAPVFDAETPPVTGTAGTGYSYTFTATGTPAPTFAVSSGVLPAGITLSSAGVLAGTPTTPGTFTFAVTASNGTAPDATSGPHSITISPALVSPVFTAETPPVTGTAGAGYSYAFAATGFPVPTFAVSSGSLPTGITLSSAGVLSGTPTTPGIFTFAVTASNGTAPAATSGPHTVTIDPAVVIPAAVTPTGTASVTLASDDLAFTGQNSVPPLIGGTVLLILGLALALNAARRRKRLRQD